ncbi:MAG TPA: caspase family protein [Humidesulfovibrio sp.]|uniref:caspase family protein n=1 Tax=Humidesulfovibrio sp. TaxID=2910988 RepID=UPI002B66D0B0|nr:caspase family protein [Humidesulfovibrio sp.]HWR05073.1 caspase family protein [Humidesulfovibrio sp.]
MLTAWLPASALADSGGRYALVIGNSAYGDKPLKNPANDARDVGRALQRLGFDVQLKTDVGQRAMEDAIRDFGLRLKRGGVGVFYYAGHGVQVQGVNYLVPIGARLGSESDAKYECVDAGRVLGKMEDAGNELNIVILDACRNNPFTRGFRSVDQGLARMDAPTGSLVAYATAPNSVASDGSGQNGLYTKYLLENINTPGVPIEEVFKRVRIGVMNETGKKQVPWESSSIAGYFYLAGGQPQGPAAIAASQMSAAQAAQQQRLQEQRLKDYLAGLEAEKRQVEQEKAELVRRRQQLDAEEAQKLKEAQAPQEARLKEQLAILETERKKLEKERAEVAVARAKAEQAQKQAEKLAEKQAQQEKIQVATAGPVIVTPSLPVPQTAAASRPQPPKPSQPPQPSQIEDRAAVLQRLSGAWRLETENGVSLPTLVLKPGGDTLYGTLEGTLADRVSLTGLAMEDGNLHVRMNIAPSRGDLGDPRRFLRGVLRGQQGERVIECVGYLRAAENGDIPIFCERADEGRPPQDQRRRIAGHMVRAW